MDQPVLGFDIGGSAVKYAPVNISTGKTLAEPSSTPLPEPATPVAVLGLIEDVLKQLHWTGPFGVGYPGVVKQGRTLSAAHMDDSFLGRDWLRDLRTLISEPMALINDADAAGLAELRFGAARKFAGSGSGTVLVATLGTGIGTALFHGGRLLPNTEFGHMQLDGREAEEWAAASVRLKEQLDWPEYGRRVNRFLQEMDKLFSPDLIVLGGGISENFREFHSYLNVTCPVVAAELGNRAGIIGAALAVTLERPG